MLKLRNLKLFITFYRSFVLATSIITLVCVISVIQSGLAALVILIWFKLITLAITALFINSYKSKDFFYYQNLGISKVKLFTITLGFDLILFVISQILSLKA